MLYINSPLPYNLGWMKQLYWRQENEFTEFELILKLVNTESSTVVYESSFFMEKFIEHEKIKI